MKEVNSNKIKGIIFDLDGTLIDSFHAIMEGFNATLPHYGLDPIGIEETKALVGKSLADTFGEMLGYEHADEATTIFRKRYKEVYLEKTTPLPHADETIKKLSAMGYRIGVATNKHGAFSRDIIAHLGWGDAVKSVVGDGDIPNTKPDPGMIYKNLENILLHEKDVVFVGDSLIDMMTGKNASVRTIGVPTGHHSKQMLLDSGAELVIDDLSQLEGAIA